MKPIFAAALILLGLVARDSDGQARIYKGLVSFIMKRCQNNADPLNASKMQNELSNFNTSFILNFLMGESPEHCTERKKDVVEHFRKLSKRLEPCFVEEEKYLQEFLVKSFEGYSDSFCIFIEDLIVEMPGKTIRCLRTFSDISHYCYKNTEIFKPNPSNVIGKHSFCQDLIKIYNCYEDNLEQHCPDAHGLVKFIIGTLRGALSPCQDIWYDILESYLKDN